MNAPKRTVLFESHLKLGARMTVFGGFEMPVQYSGIIEEHRAVRSNAGVFDLSHMGEFEVSGPRALNLLNRAFTNLATAIREGRAQYTIMCAEDGGVVDDLIIYRLGAEKYLLCVNASNVDTDREWLIDLNRAIGADFRDLSDETALVAIQGPASVATVSRMADFAIGKVPRFGVQCGGIAGVRCVAARTGYTGEDGFEIFVGPARAEQLFHALLDANAKPCGLGARDTLRLEAALPLYGHELDRRTSPLEAGLASFVKSGHDFVGETALARQRDAGVRKRLVGLITQDARTIARQGYRVFSGEKEIGVVTSGTFAPTANRPIAMAYVAFDTNLSPGAEAQVEVRNRRVAARITALPFYRAGRMVI